MKWFLAGLWSLVLLVSAAAEAPSPWAVYVGSMDGHPMPVILLDKVDDQGRTVGKTGIYLYQGDQHPSLGIIQGDWDPGRSTLEGRWWEVQMVGDDLEPQFAGDIILAMGPSGFNGARQVDGDTQHTYGFSVDQPARQPDSDEKAMYFSQLQRYAAWVRAHPEQ